VARHAVQRRARGSHHAQEYERLRQVPCVRAHRPLHDPEPALPWSHLELRRYFGINDVINEQTAPKIWEKANKKLATPELTTQGILTKFKVAVVFTTDDPIDSLEHHVAIAKSGLTTRVYPTFRPDKALLVGSPAAFNPWCDKLAARADVDIKDLASFLGALKKRHDFFHSSARGCRTTGWRISRTPTAPRRRPRRFSPRRAPAPPPRPSRWRNSPGS